MGKHLRHVLHFVPNGRQPQRVQKTAGIVAEPRDDARVFEPLVVGPGDQVAQQKRLARPTRPGQHRRREIFRAAPKQRFHLSQDVLHK